MMFPCLHAVNPHMREEPTRLQTFDERWPSNRVCATAQQIAKAGFYFLGERDRVKCWYCNGGLQNWEPLDEPWREHAKWFPTYVSRQILNKGCTGRIIFTPKNLCFLHSLIVLLSRKVGFLRLKLKQFNLILNWSNTPS